MANPIVEAFIKAHLYDFDSVDKVACHAEELCALIAQLIPEGPKPIVDPERFIREAADKAAVWSGDCRNIRVLPMSALDTILITLTAMQRHSKPYEDCAAPEPLPTALEQIAAEPKRDTCKGTKWLGNPHDIDTGEWPCPGCPDCATPSSVEGRRCLKPDCRMEGSRICAGPYNAQPFGGEGCGALLSKNDRDHSEWCGHPAACHEVATPGTDAREKQ